MFKVIVILIVLASLLMIGIVLIQKSKGGGLASNFASNNQILGVRKTNSFVEKATWTLAIVICVLSIMSAFFIGNPTTQSGPRAQATATEQTKAPEFPTAQKQAAPAANKQEVPAAAENAKPAAETPASTPAK